MEKLLRTGERQVGVTRDKIRDDHLARYEWAATFVSPEMRVMDAGCGIGYGAVLLADAGASVLAVDRDAEAISLARAHWQHDSVSYQVGNLNFVHNPGEDRFDLIVAFEVVEHLVSPELFLRQIQTLAKPDATVLLSVPNESCIAHSIDLNPFHIRHFVKSELEDLALGCGLLVERVYHQDNREIREDGDGRTLVAVCRIKPSYTPGCRDSSDLERAYEKAELELHKRSEAIRQLQALSAPPGTNSTPRNLGIWQFSVRERAAQITAEQNRQTLNKISHQLQTSEHELLKLQNSHKETLSSFNRANVTLQAYGDILREKDNQIGLLENAQRTAVAEQKVKSEQLKQLRTARARESEQLKQLRTARARESGQLKQLRTAQARQKKFFDPARPTLAGLFRLMKRHRLFVGIILQAPLNTAKNLISVSRRKRANGSGMLSK
ncbi:class I SAM-dependent methyltransferase [Paracoccus sp. PAR01]|uniref:class I SAM-dependent methyltransferase n=1 Tax=Paracoccus sp. PAR01 TaxID=2769282 RepID=UPI00178572A5|nr:class I SAM-dependent methyltransferase [Paracoccus sp. PAR01]MBD9526941.1 methyltransferase domain-containing protein [Paracoccus sp. PAR01]